MALWVLPPKLALQASEVLIPSPLQDRGAPGQGNALRNLCRQCPTSINSAETLLINLWDAAGAFINSTAPVQMLGSSLTH